MALCATCNDPLAREAEPELTGIGEVTVALLCD
jgi:hypothetical protein